MSNRPLNELPPRALVRTLYDRAVAAADPAAAVRRALEQEPLPRPAPGGRLVVMALGKAAMAMAGAAAALCPSDRVLIITTPAMAGPLAGAEVLAGGHPVPDARSLVAGEALAAAAEGLGRGDVALVLISGGGSALAVAPVAGVSLADKAEVSRLLLASGADIAEMNLVRQSLSRLKGGGLARLAARARLRALILSDVVGDDLRVIASGPTAAPLGPPDAAQKVLVARGLWDRVPPAVRRHLEHAPPAPPAGQEVENRLIGSNALSVAAMAQGTGGRVVQPLVGDVAEAAARIWDCAGPGLTLFGGETTVTLRGTGRGGRNQELALRVALLAEERGITAPFVFLSGGTDGRDGPTDAAGAVVDGGTLARIRAAGIDPRAALAENDSYPALAAAGDLLLTGETGTNVADVQVMLR
ncbi:glycerate kinase [Plastorhodobacter daqingensis]|uniref:Glycerate kinase n=1 Tax=Plastorhodobacter daqingensis TaxID=1387281 RepID=A0ABW2UK74_9RHOB